MRLSSFPLTSSQRVQTNAIAQRKADSLPPLEFGAAPDKTAIALKTARSLKVSKFLNFLIGASAAIGGGYSWQQHSLEREKAAIHEQVLTDALATARFSVRNSYNTSDLLRPGSTVSQKTLDSARRAKLGISLEQLLVHAAPALTTVTGKPVYQVDSGLLPLPFDYDALRVLQGQDWIRTHDYANRLEEAGTLEEFGKILRGWTLNAPVSFFHDPDHRAAVIGRTELFFDTLQEVKQRQVEAGTYSKGSAGLALLGLLSVALGSTRQKVETKA